MSLPFIFVTANEDGLEHGLDARFKPMNLLSAQHFFQCKEHDKKREQKGAPTFFVKVYMEGIPIGRKLDLFALNGYDCLVQTLDPDTQVSLCEASALTYEDKEGDWMMVGDVPWEMLLSTVKKLKIARADKC